MKVRRVHRLSHLCLLIPQLFYLLTLLFLFLLLFLLSPSAAEAVQTTEAGTGEGHGLSDAPHPREPAEGKGGRRGKRGRGGECVKTFFLLHLAICRDITLLVRSFFLRSLLNTHGYLESKKKKGVFILLCILRQSEFSSQNL